MPGGPKYWVDRHNQQTYLTWLARVLGFKRFGDWYRLSKQHLVDHGGLSLLKRHHGSIYLMLVNLFPGRIIPNV